jgi:hypothetical protein
MSRRAAFKLLIEVLAEERSRILERGGKPFREKRLAKVVGVRRTVPYPPTKIAGQLSRYARICRSTASQARHNLWLAVLSAEIANGVSKTLGQYLKARRKSPAQDSL